MEASFFNHEENLATLIFQTITMDNDSGYVTHNTDSNSNSFLEISGDSNALPCEKSIYLSEDALLEKPEIKNSGSKYPTSCYELSHDEYSNITEKMIEYNKENLFELYKENHEYNKEIHYEYDKNFFLEYQSEIIEYNKNNLDKCNKNILDEYNKNNLNEYSSLFFTEKLLESSVKSEDEISCIGLNSVEESEASVVISPVKSIVVNLDALEFKGINSISFNNDEYSSQILSNLEDCSNSSNKENDINFINKSFGESDIIQRNNRENDKININRSSNISNVSSLLKTKNTPKKTTSKTKTPQKSKPELINVTYISTPEKSYKNKVDPTISPDLFSDEEEILKFPEKPIFFKTKPFEEQYLHKNDRKLLRRVQENLSGVLPPPSFTAVSLTVDQILDKIKKNKHLFIDHDFILNKNESESNCGNIFPDQTNSEGCQGDDKKKSLLLTTDLKTGLELPWPEVLEVRCFGLHHNRNKTTEEFESLCAKYASRYVSAETQSLSSIIESPSKRKSTKLKWTTKSPGRRLSHLAKRRITFSSASLQAGSSSLTSHSRQILIDSRKLQLLTRRKSPRKSPKKSPRKTPKKTNRTPNTSGSFTEEIENNIKSSSNRVASTKRALFQSPDHEKSNIFSRVVSSTSNAKSSPFKKRPTPKKALFASPLKKSPWKSPIKKNLFENKRKRDSTDEMESIAKFPRSLSFNACQNNENKRTNLIKFKSEANLNSSSSGELSNIHKKKLQWAVYEALRSHNIGIKDPNFKIYASVLARVTKRFFLPNPSSNTHRPEGGTSERMLRIARQHVFSVIKGKSVDEIVQDYQKSRLKIAKPSGYISKEQANSFNQENRECNSNSSHKGNVLQDRSNILNSNDKGSSTKLKSGRLDNKVDRVRKVINFDEDNQCNVA